MTKTKQTDISDGLLGAITPTQAKRLTQHLAGASVREIARNEGVAKSSVQESLASPNVRRALTIFGYDIQMTTKIGGKETTAIKAALEVLIDLAASGTRPLIVGEQVKYVRDDRLRMEAACRLLGYVDKRLPPEPSAPPPSTVEIERTVTASERCRVTPGRSLPENDGGAA